MVLVRLGLSRCIALFLIIYSAATSLKAQELCGLDRLANSPHTHSINKNTIAAQSSMRNMIMIRVRFLDTPSPYPLSFGGVVALDDSTALQLISDTRQFLEEVSYSQESLQAVLTPVYTLPLPTPINLNSLTSPPYGWTGVKDWALQAAQADGFNIADYDLQVVAATYVFTGFDGHAFGGSNGYAGYYLNGNWFAATSVHELGHTFWFPHAGYWLGNNGTTLGPGSLHVLGNPFDIMGYAMNSPTWAAKHYNAYSKLRRGWLTIGSGPLAVKQITQSGVYRLYPLETDQGPGERALKVDFGNQSYVVEARALQTSNARAMNGLIITKASGSSATLLDLTPETPGGGPVPANREDAPLVVGQTFADRTNGIYITPIRKVATVPPSYDVAVFLNDGSPNHNPTLQLSVSSKQLSAGQLFTFNASAADQDGDALAYYWRFVDGNGNPLTQTLGPNARQLKISWSAPGTYQVFCTVSDMRGGLKTERISVNVF